MRFRFVKETKEVVEAERDFLLSTEILPTVLENGAIISHDSKITMIDGKVHTILSDKTNSFMCCSICGLTPTLMSNLEVVKRHAQALDDSDVERGVSTLHCWIRALEYTLHLAYRLDSKEWRLVKTSEAFKQSQAQKFRIQKELREEMGILVDFPKQNGSGTTNDGNTARTFFRNSEAASQITGIDEAIIKRLHVILCVVSSNKEVDVDKFEEYAWDTYKRMTSTYPWFRVPAAVHKLLAHTPKAMRVNNLSLGMYSEEAQEALNKVVKVFKLGHTRKDKRVHTMTDLMNRLLVYSDPKLASLRRKPPKKKELDLPEEAKDLLKDD